MGSPSIPQVSPQQSAQAEALSQLAGNEFNIGTAPLQAYAEAINALQFNPTFQRIANADSANSALANAQAAKQVQSQVNPYAAAGADAMTKAANMRLGQTMGQPITPGLTPGNTSQAFQYPSSGSLPPFQQIMDQAKAITNAFPNEHVYGNSVAIDYPTRNSQMPPLFNPQSYYSVGGSGA